MPEAMPKPTTTPEQQKLAIKESQPGTNEKQVIMIAPSSLTRKEIALMIAMQEVEKRKKEKAKTPESNWKPKWWAGWYDKQLWAKVKDGAMESLGLDVAKEYKVQLKRLEQIEQTVGEGGVAALVEADKAVYEMIMGYDQQRIETIKAEMKAEEAGIQDITEFTTIAVEGKIQDEIQNLVAECAKIAASNDLTATKVSLLVQRQLRLLANKQFSDKTITNSADWKSFIKMIQSNEGVSNLSNVVLSLVVEANKEINKQTEVERQEHTEGVLRLDDAINTLSKEISLTFASANRQGNIYADKSKGVVGFLGSVKGAGVAGAAVASVMGVAKWGARAGTHFTGPIFGALLGGAGGGIMSVLRAARERNQADIKRALGKESNPKIHGYEMISFSDLQTRITKAKSITKYTEDGATVINQVVNDISLVQRMLRKHKKALLQTGKELSGTEYETIVQNLVQVKSELNLQLLDLMKDINMTDEQISQIMHVQSLARLDQEISTQWEIEQRNLRDGGRVLQQAALATAIGAAGGAGGFFFGAGVRDIFGGFQDFDKAVDKGFSKLAKLFNTTPVDTAEGSVLLDGNSTHTTSHSLPPRPDFRNVGTARDSYGQVHYAMRSAGGQPTELNLLQPDVSPAELPVELPTTPIVISIEGLDTSTDWVNARFDVAKFLAQDSNASTIRDLINTLTDPEEKAKAITIISEAITRENGKLDITDLDPENFNKFLNRLDVTNKDGLAVSQAVLPQSQARLLLAFENPDVDITTRDGVFTALTRGSYLSSVFDNPEFSALIPETDRITTITAFVQALEVNASNPEFNLTEIDNVKDAFENYLNNLQSANNLDADKLRQALGLDSTIADEDVFKQAAMQRTRIQLNIGSLDTQVAQNLEEVFVPTPAPSPDIELPDSMTSTEFARNLSFAGVPSLEGVEISPDGTITFDSILETEFKKAIEGAMGDEHFDGLIQKVLDSAGVNDIAGLEADSPAKNLVDYYTLLKTSGAPERDQFINNAIAEYRANLRFTLQTAINEGVDPSQITSGEFRFVPGLGLTNETGAVIFADWSPNSGISELDINPDNIFVNKVNSGDTLVGYIQKFYPDLTDRESRLAFFEMMEKINPEAVYRIDQPDGGFDYYIKSFVNDKPTILRMPTAEVVSSATQAVSAVEQLPIVQTLRDSGVPVNISMLPSGEAVIAVNDGNTQIISFETDILGNPTTTIDPTVVNNIVNDPAIVQLISDKLPEGSSAVQNIGIDPEGNITATLEDGTEIQVNNQDLSITTDEIADAVAETPEPGEIGSPEAQAVLNSDGTTIGFTFEGNTYQLNSDSEKFNVTGLGDKLPDNFNSLMQEISPNSIILAITSADGLDLSGLDSLEGLYLNDLTSADGLDLSGLDSLEGLFLNGLTSADGLDLSGLDSLDYLGLDGLTSTDGLDLSGLDGLGALRLGGLTSTDGLDLIGLNSLYSLGLEGLTSADDIYGLLNENKLPTSLRHIYTSLSQEQVTVDLADKLMNDYPNLKLFEGNAEINLQVVVDYNQLDSGNIVSVDNLNAVFAQYEVNSDVNISGLPSDQIDQIVIPEGDTVKKIIATNITTYANLAKLVNIGAPDSLVSLETGIIVNINNIEPSLNITDLQMFQANGYGNVELLVKDANDNAVNKTINQWIADIEAQQATIPAGASTATATSVPPTATAAASATGTAEPSATPTGETSTATATSVPPTATAEPSATPTETAEPSATPTETAEPSATPTETAEPSATPIKTTTSVPPTAEVASPTAEPTSTREATATTTSVPPTATATAEPTSTRVATATATSVPPTAEVASPTAEPSATATVEAPLTIDQVNTVAELTQFLAENPGTTELALPAMTANDIQSLAEVDLNTITEITLPNVTKADLTLAHLEALLEAKRDLVLTIENSSTTVTDSAIELVNQDIIPSDFPKLQPLQGITTENYIMDSAEANTLINLATEISNLSPDKLKSLDTNVLTQYASYLNIVLDNLLDANNNIKDAQFTQLKENLEQALNHVGTELDTRDDWNLGAIGLGVGGLLGLAIAGRTIARPLWRAFGPGSGSPKPPKNVVPTSTSGDGII